MKEKKDHKRLLAAALKYEPSQDVAPRVTAKGQGWIAEKIITLAHKHNIPIKNDPVLVEMLSKLDLGEQIPEELYQAVAEILAFVYRLNERSKAG